MQDGYRLAATIFVAFLSIIGAIGNCIVLLFYTRKHGGPTSTIFIRALSWCDLFVCLFVMPSTIAAIQTEDRLVYDVVCKLYIFLFASLEPLSPFLIVAIAMDRYLFICHPLLNAVTPFRARISIVCLCLVAFVIGLIMSCSYGVYTREVVTTNCSDNIKPLTFNKNITIEDVEVKVIAPTDHVCSNTKGDGLVYNKGGYCKRNDILISSQVYFWYLNIFSFLFILCVVIIIVIYILVFRTIIKQNPRGKKKLESELTTEMFSIDITNNSNTTNLNQTKGTSVDKQIEPHLHVPANALDIGSSVDDNIMADNSTPKHSNDSGIPGNVTFSIPSPNVNTPKDTESQNSFFKDLAQMNFPYKEVSPQTIPSSKEGAASDNGIGQKTINLYTSKSYISSSMRQENIRMVAMIFVVTLVYINSFIPALLMQHDLIDYNILVFYMLFINYASNPIIYTFMNPSFRKKLSSSFRRVRQFFRCC